MKPSYTDAAKVTLKSIYFTDDLSLKISKGTFGIGEAKLPMSIYRLTFE